MQFEMLGTDEIAVPLAVMYVDHNVLQIDDKNMQDHRYLRSFSQAYGLLFSPPGHGISHYVHLERFARPGALLLGADSHSTMAGAVGMFATGAGGLEVAVAMAGYGFDLPCPRVVGVELTGRLSPGVEAKDVILELLRRHGVRGAGGRCSSSSATASRRSRRRAGPRSATWSSRPAPPRGSSRRTQETRRWLATQEPRGGVHAAGGGPRCRVRRGRADRPVHACAAGRAAAVARERRPGRRGGGDGRRAGVRRVVGEQLLRGPRDGRGRAARPQRRSPVSC